MKIYLSIYHLHTYTYIHTHTYTHTHTPIHPYTHIQTHTSIYIYTCINIIQTYILAGARFACRVKSVRGRQHGF